MSTPRRTRSTALAAAVGLALLLGACGSDDAGDTTATGDTATSPSASPPAEETTEQTTEQTTEAPPAPDRPFGEGCAAVPAQGEGSFAGMADDPVVTAAGNNPTLSTLARAVQAANLVEALNSAQDITVLAPADPAFQAIPSNNVQALLADVPKLTAVLTHHVIQGRLAPDQLVGTHTTLNNDEVTIEGGGTDFSIAAASTVLRETDARVLCGNVRTANATVYIIDSVLQPPS